MQKQISAISIVLAMGLPAFARDEFTRTFDQSRTVSAGQRVRVQHRMGNLEIHGQSGHDLRVHAVVKVSAGSEGDAKRYADSIRIEVQPSADSILIETVYPKTEALPWFRNISYSVSYEIQLPESSPLEVSNAFGWVHVSGLRAGGSIATSHGRLEFRDGQGSQRLENSFSDVVVERNQGDVTVANTNGTVEVSDVSGIVQVKNRFGRVALARTGGGSVNNGNGAVDVNRVSGDMKVTTSFAAVSATDVKGALTVQSQNGAVRAERIGSWADLTTSFAAVDFSEIGGALTVKANNAAVKGRMVAGAVAIQTSFAAVSVEEAKKGVRVISQNGSVTLNRTGEDAYVKTSFAAVRLEQVAGAVEVVNQNGEVEVGLVRQGACRPITLQTSFAPIRVRIGDNASYAVVAKTSFAKIHSDFPMMVSGALSGDSVSGNIGAGSCPMRLVDQNGSIDILK